MLVAALLLYAALGSPQFLAILTAALIIAFATRAMALFLAKQASRSGHTTQALALLRVALAIYPWSADALALLGALALAHGHPDEAEKHLRRAIRLLPAQPSFYAALSGALIELERPHEAAQAASEALRLDPQLAQARLYLAEAMRLCGAPAEQVEAQIRSGIASATAPELAAALQCALAASLISQQRLAEASLTLHTAEGLLPKCSTLSQAEIGYILGELLASLGESERARSYFQGVERLAPQGKFVAAAWRGLHVG